MKGPKGYIDLGTVFDEIFEAARDFQNEFRKNFNAEDCRGRRTDSRWPEGSQWIFNENTDYYPNYSYPPMNVFMTQDRSLIFEFALAGFDEKDISLSFQGDYMVFSANVPRPDSDCNMIQDENPEIRYFKRRLKM